MPFSALLDANVLVPNVLRDTLLTVAESGFYRPLWSEDILVETRRAILRIRPDLRPAQLDRLFSAMNQAFDDALVTGYRSLVAGMTNDEGDRHVLAAAVVGRADVIITRNVKHFPKLSVDAFGIEVLTPDRFLCLQYDLAPAKIVELIKSQSDGTGRAPGKRRLNVVDLLEILEQNGASSFAELVRGRLAAARLRPRSPRSVRKVTVDGP